MEEYGDVRHWTTSIGTGPFMLEDYVAYSHLTYIRNPDYFRTDPRNGNQLPYVDGVEVVLIPDITTRIAAVRTGRLDFYESMSWEYKDAVATAAPDLQWATIIDAVTYNVWFKTTVEPFDNLKVRQALAMAIDRREIADTVFPAGSAKVLNWLVPETNVAIYTPYEELPAEAKKVYTYDPVAAKALLAEADYPDGFTTGIQYTAAGVGFAWAEDALIMIKDYWKKNLNVDLELTLVDLGTRGALRIPPYPYDAILGDVVGYTLYAITHDYHYSGAPANRAINSDPYIDERIDKIRVEPDLETRNALYKDVTTYILGQALYISLPSGPTYTAWWPWLSEYTGQLTIGTQAWGEFMANLWLDLDLKEEMIGKR